MIFRNTTCTHANISHIYVRLTTWYDKENLALIGEEKFFTVISHVNAGHEYAITPTSAPAT